MPRSCPTCICHDAAWSSSTDARTNRSNSIPKGIYTPTALSACKSPSFVSLYLSLFPLKIIAVLYSVSAYNVTSTFHCLIRGPSTPPLSLNRAGSQCTKDNLHCECPCLSQILWCFSPGMDVFQNQRLVGVRPRPRYPRR